eukprot:15481176-Alexandrium_andersonii.AAC.1
MWTDRHNVGSRAPVAPEPHTVLPLGAEASVVVRTAEPGNARKHKLAGPTEPRARSRTQTARGAPAQR